jgi:hypothetical protein
LRQSSRTVAAVAANGRIASVSPTPINLSLIVTLARPLIAKILANGFIDVFPKPGNIYCSYFSAPQVECAAANKFLRPQQVRAATPGPLTGASVRVRSYAAEAKASPTEVSSILEQRIRGVQEEAGLAETGRVLSVGYAYFDS